MTYVLSTKYSVEPPFVYDFRVTDDIATKLTQKNQYLDVIF